jgi:hypothetical protein
MLMLLLLLLLQLMQSTNKFWCYFLAVGLAESPGHLYMRDEN